MPSTANMRLQRGPHGLDTGLWRREPMVQRLLRDEAVTHPHLEDAAAPPLQLDVDAERFLNGGRRTGSPGLVVSRHAVRDANHAALLVESLNPLCVDSLSDAQHLDDWALRIGAVA